MPSQNDDCPGFASNDTKPRRTIHSVWDGYHAQVGTSVHCQQLRNRVNWMTAQVSGSRVLDVGCGDGTAAILLAREGTNVLGLDTDHAMIAIAQSITADEADTVQARVRFRQDNILCDGQQEGQKNYSYNAAKTSKTVQKDHDAYTTIIIGHVLDTLVRASDVITAAHRLLAPSGFLVVSVPFGLTAGQDHKHSFYHVSLIKLLTRYFDITRIDYIDDWIGVVAQRRDTVSEDAAQDNKIWDSTAAMVEVAFHAAEQRHMATRGAIQYDLEDALRKLDAKDAALVTAAADLVDLRAKMDTYYATAADQTARVIDLHRQIDARMVDIGLLGLSANSQTKKMTALKIEVEMAKKRAGVADLQLARLYRTTSWRITWPIRKVLLMIRSVIDK